MSLNFIESLLDKLSPRDSGNSILKNWTGPQNLVGNNVSFNDNILYKYQEALLEGNDSSTNLSVKRSPFESTMFPFHQSVSPNSLVSRVSKLFFPTASSFQDYSRRIQDNNSNHTLGLNKVTYTEDNLWEEFMQEAFNFAVNISKHHSNYYKHNPSNSVKRSINTADLSDAIAAICTSSSVNKLPGMVVECLVGSSPSQQIEKHIEPEVTVEVLASCPTQAKDKLCGPDMAVVTVNDSITVINNSGQKKKIADNGTLNQELANRKTKEIQKRSKNRRRRQKKSNKSKNVQMGSPSVSNDQSSKAQNLCEVDSAVSQFGCGLMNNVRKCARNNSATLCNVINISDKAKNVQIILPDVSSFVITVDSAGDDSDWDEDSDSEWLNDASEFEFCGLNVANLPSSKPNTSLLSVPQCQDEDVEALQLNMLLQRVNKEWNEATKDLDGKSRSSVKVSFVPDEELVEILPVEVYERKGEWEMYALERLRFKRRIDELDRIISPCLTREHRERILQKYHTIDL